MWAPVFFLVATLRRVGVTQLTLIGVLLVSGRLPAIVLVLAPIAGLIVLVVAIARWLRFTFHVEDAAIIVRRGVLATERLSIPFDRVQSISIDQEFLHRPIGLVRVRVDTAGSSEAELDIAATSRQNAEALQRAVGHERRDQTAVGEADASEAPDPGARDEVLAKRTVGDLTLIALTRRPLAGLALVLPLVAVAENIDGWFDITAPDTDRFGDAGGLALLLGVVVLATGAAVVLAALRIAGVVIRDFDLTLHRSDAGLRRDAGLFDRRSETSSIDRIQQIETSQGILQRRAGFWSLDLPTAGDSDSLRLLGARAHEIELVRSLVLEHDTHVDRLDRRIPSSAALYWARVPAVLIVIGSVVLAATTTWLMIIGLALVPVTIGLAWLRQRRFRWGLTSTGLALRRGVFTINTTELAQRRIQSVRLRRNLFEQRRDLATVEVRTADSRIEVPMLPHDDAAALRDRLLATVIVDDRPWF